MFSFAVCSLGEDDLGEDEDSRSGNSDDESTADEDDTQQSRLDCAIVTTTSDVNRETHTMDKVGHCDGHIGFFTFRIHV